MHISKKTSRVLTVLILFAFGIIVYLMLPSNEAAVSTVSQTSDPSATPTLPPPDPNANFILNDFHRIETKNGKKVWEIKAARGQYLAEKSQAKVEIADLMLQRPDGDQIEIKARNALLNLQGTSLTTAELEGEVYIELIGKLKAWTKKATLDRSKNLVFSPTRIKLEAKRMKLAGNKLEGDLKNEKFILSGDVDTVLEPEK